MKGKTASFLDDLDRRVVAIRSILREAFERISTERQGRIDRIDTEVVLDQFDEADEYAFQALCVLHPELDDVVDDAFVDALAAIEARHPSEPLDLKDNLSDFIQHAALLVILATVGTVDAIEEGHRCPQTEELSQIMAVIAELMSFTIYVLDPRRFERGWIDESDLSERVRLVAKLEGYELRLEEARKIAFVSRQTPR